MVHILALIKAIHFIQKYWPLILLIVVSKLCCFLFLCSIFCIFVYYAQGLIYLYRFPKYEEIVDEPFKKMGDLCYYADINSPITFVHFYGNASCARGESKFCRELYIKRICSNVIIVEYPGYGGNMKIPSERSIISHIKKLYKEMREMRIIKDCSVYFHGNSIGAAVALHSVKYFESLNGIVLCNPFLSIEDIMREIGIPHQLSILMRDKWRNYIAIQKLKIPCLIFNALDDSIIPSEHRDILYSLCSSKKYMCKYDGGHNDFPVTCRLEMISFIVNCEKNPNKFIRNII